MVEEAERIAGRRALNTTQQRFESKEQQQLKKDIATIQAIEEEWWGAGTLKEKSATVGKD
eukprot:2238703-Rhodomonas_salina.1